jgi:uncharacterized damage-inducible protein DinB
MTNEPSPSATARVEPPVDADEATMLSAWLDAHRATVHRKCAGLGAEHAVAAPLPSSPLTSIGGIVSHLRWVEHAWFEILLLDLPDEGYATPDDPDAEWRRGTEIPLPQLLDEYEAQCERSRAITARLDLDTPALRARKDEDPTTLRWVLVHMIEETARHNGHLDLLRELADGTTGE